VAKRESVMRGIRLGDRLRAKSGKADLGGILREGIEETGAGGAGPHGDNRETFFSAGAIAAYAPRDPTTSRELAKLSGERTIEGPSYGSTTDGKQSHSINFQRRENIMPRIQAHEKRADARRAMRPEPVNSATARIPTAPGGIIARDQCPMQWCRAPTSGEYPIAADARQPAAYLDDGQ
jgi:hypothetical protein